MRVTRQSDSLFKKSTIEYDFHPESSELYQGLLNDGWSLTTDPTEDEIYESGEGRYPLFHKNVNGVDHFLEHYRSGFFGPKNNSNGGSWSHIWGQRSEYGSIDPAPEWDLVPYKSLQGALSQASRVMRGDPYPLPYGGNHVPVHEVLGEEPPRQSLSTKLARERINLHVRDGDEDSYIYVQPHEYDEAVHLGTHGPYSYHYLAPRDGVRRWPGRPQYLIPETFTMHHVFATTPTRYGDLKVGDMRWSPKTGEIHDIVVHPSFRGQDIADKMYELGKNLSFGGDVTYPLHSQDQTDTGYRWAERPQNQGPYHKPISWDQE